jgi:hypothetical protein
MALAETEVEVPAWLDRLAIQDLIYRSSDALTRADLKQFAPHFAAKVSSTASVVMVMVMAYRTLTRHGQADRQLDLMLVGSAI